MEKEITSASEPESRYYTSLNEAVNTLLKTVCTTQQKQEKNDSLKTGFGNLEFYNKELIILGAKNNNGEVGGIHILFHPATNSFIYSENLE